MHGLTRRPYNPAQSGLPGKDRSSDCGQDERRDNFPTDGWEQAENGQTVLKDAESGTGGRWQGNCGKPRFGALPPRVAGLRALTALDSILSGIGHVDGEMQSA